MTIFDRGTFAPLFLLKVACLLLAGPTMSLGDESPPRPPALPAGDAVIRAPVGESEIVITTASRLAGAIHSLTWKGKEFVDSSDHGRQIQSASNFDTAAPFIPETFNPTEAGSVDDGAGTKSSSVLLHLLAKDNMLQSTSRMAFWLSPTGKSAGHPARNTTVVSDHLLTKRVTIGYQNLSNVIQYDVTFGVPIGEKHTFAQFEVVTGYMPAEFQSFWSYHTGTRELVALSDGPGEQPFPVILSTEDGCHAMGIVMRDPPGNGLSKPGYGRFRFPDEKVVKWNCVSRLRNDAGIPAADYGFRTFVIVGDLTTVKKSMDELRLK